MKTIKRISAALLVTLALTVSSCGGSDDNGGGGFSGPSTGTFIKATAAGSNFLSEGQFAVGNYADGSLVLTGSSTTGNNIGIQLYAVSGALAVGTYNMSADQDSDVVVGNLQYTAVNLSTFAVTPYSSVNCENASGTLEITFIDATKIEGTFSFLGKEVKPDETCDGGTKNVTNGSFRLEL
jgi:hypothetical protein